MRGVGLSCALLSCVITAALCCCGFWAGLYRQPRDITTLAFGPGDVWLALCLGVPALIGAVTLLIYDWK